MGLGHERGHWGLQTLVVVVGGVVPGSGSTAMMFRGLENNRREVFRAETYEGGRVRPGLEQGPWKAKMCPCFCRKRG